MGKLRIALWNGAGLDNIGDHLIDFITSRELVRRIPGAECVTFTPWPSRSCPRRLKIDCEGRWPGEGDFQAIVVGGGSLITGPPFADPGGQFFLLGPYPDKFRDPAPVLWSAVCANTQHLAPLRDTWKAYVVSAGNRVMFHTVRNERTRAFLRSCGLKAPVEIVPDVGVLAASPDQRSPCHKGRPRIGFAIGRPVFPPAFIAKMAALAMSNSDAINPEVVRIRPYQDNETFDDIAYAAALADRIRPLAKSYGLTIFSFGPMYGDALSVAQLAKILPEAKSITLKDPLGQDAIAVIKSLDCLVAFRLHACILALATGTPHVAVDPYYEEAAGTSKLREYMVDAGFGKLYLTLKELLRHPHALHEAIVGALGVRRQEVASTHSSLAARVTAHFVQLAEAITLNAYHYGDH